MYSVSIIRHSKSTFIDVLESSYLCKDILNHDLIEKLINGTLKEELFKLFIKQQAWLWYEISQRLVTMSRPKHTIYTKPLLLKIANFSLIEADSLSDQLSNFNIYSYEALPVCKDYLNFLNTLEDKFLFLTAILPRFWLKAKLRRRFVKLSLFKHPYKKYIKHCLYNDAREPITRIINTLDTQLQSISEEKKPEIKQAFLEGIKHEHELLNQIHYLAPI